MIVRATLVLALLASPALAQRGPAARLEPLKRELMQDIESRSQFTQQMVDQIFSFGELGLVGGIVVGFSAASAWHETKWKEDD